MTRRNTSSRTQGIDIWGHLGPIESPGGTFTHEASAEVTGPGPLFDTR